MTSPISHTPVPHSRSSVTRPRLTCAVGRTPAGQAVVEIRHRGRFGPAWKAQAIRVPAAEVEDLIAALRAAAQLARRFPGPAPT